MAENYGPYTSPIKEIPTEIALSRKDLRQINMGYTYPEIPRIVAPVGDTPKTVATYRLKQTVPLKYEYHTCHM